MRLFAAAGLLLALGSAGPVNLDMARWQREAANVTVVRDDWGIAHVHGKTDAGDIGRNLRDVYYYEDQLAAHTVRTYHP